MTASHNAVRARLSDAEFIVKWHRHRSTQVAQRYRQFGFHRKIEIDAIVARSLALISGEELAPRAQCDRLGIAAEAATEHSAHPSLASTGSTQRWNRQCPALKEFTRIVGLDGAFCHDEWMTVLNDGVELIVADPAGRPSPLQVAKGAAIVQSRFYLEQRARQLLARLGSGGAAWHLLTIDFGVEARRHESEFLMCFVGAAADADADAECPSVSSPYVEIGFAVLANATADRQFALTLKTVSGMPKKTPV